MKCDATPRRHMAGECECWADSLWELHFIASGPSHGGAHVDPDGTVGLLGVFPLRADAERAGRLYLRMHPEAWVQVTGAAGQGIDVMPGEPGGGAP